MNKNESNNNDENGVAWRGVGGDGYKEKIYKAQRAIPMLK